MRRALLPTIWAGSRAFFIHERTILRFWVFVGAVSRGITLLWHGYIVIYIRRIWLGIFVYERTKRNVINDLLSLDGSVRRRNTLL
jgi:hypothetical protein